MNAEEGERYQGILAATHPPDRDAYRAGWDAHGAGTPFHHAPDPKYSVASLSWRLGWNDRAIGLSSRFP